MAFSVWINETDLSSLGLYVEDIPGWLHAPSRNYQVTEIPGLMGGVLSLDPTYPPRPVSIVGSVDPALRTVAQRRSFEDQLKALAYRGLVTLTVDDDVNPPLRIDGVAMRAPFDPVAHWATTQLSRARIDLTCPDPTWYALQGSSLAFGATPTPVPLGTAVSSGKIRIAAPAWSANVTDPIVSYYSASRVLVQSMSFPGVTLTAGVDYLEIDLNRSTVVEYAAGVATDRISLLVGDFFALDPFDGDTAAGAFPFLAVTGAAGNPSGQALYLKRYL